MKTTVVYHSADFDGLFCREIARKFLPYADFIGWDFRDEPLTFPHLKTEQLIVMDLPIDRVFGIQLHEGWVCRDGKQLQPIDRWDKSNIVWIDHHRSSILSHPQDIPGYRLEGVSACRLAWQWFNRGRDDGYALNVPSTKEPYVERRVREPLAVRLAGEYDIFDKRDPNAELFQHGLRSEELTEEMWFKLLHYVNGGITVDRLLQQGRLLQFARDNEYADVIKQQGFDLPWEGVVFLACNSHELDIRSQLFEAGIQPYHEALLGFTFNGKDWRVSMYHITGKEHIDILRIASENGGGGHPGACGCRLKTLPWL